MRGGTIAQDFPADAAGLLYAFRRGCSGGADVKWGVNKADVLRIVVDVTDTAGYAVDMDGNTLNLTVNADKGAQVPQSKAVKSSLADSMKIVDKGSYTVVRVPLKQHVPGKNYKAFVLKKDPATGRPFRVVLDVTPKQASYSGSGAATTVVRNRPVVSNRPTKNNSSIKKNTVIKTSTAADKKADKKKSSSKKKNDNKKNTAAAKTETTVQAVAWMVKSLLWMQVMVEAIRVLSAVTVLRKKISPWLLQK